MNALVVPLARTLDVLTIVGDVGIAAYFVSIPLGTVSKPIKTLRDQAISGLAPLARTLAFLVALMSMAGSLFFSEIAKYPPCALCWWQRVFMYPQTILLAMGIMKNDKNIADYVTGLSVAGLIISLYQYYIQMGGKMFIQCDATGISCTQRFPADFGYVTIPMMAMTGFLALIILMRIARQSR